MKEKIIILDFGSQYTQLIARRIREQNIFCEVHPFNKIMDTHIGIKGVILSGSPYSVGDAEHPVPILDQFPTHIPVLGICYGAQLLAKRHGGAVYASKTREYGRAHLTYIEANNVLLRGIDTGSQVWMSHGDTIEIPPNGAHVICSTEDVEVAGFHFKDTATYGIQFHPEVYHSLDGERLLRNFMIDICHCAQDWTSDSFVSVTIAALKLQLGNDKVVLGLSGGVDSTVAATLLHKAIGSNLYCIFVNNGLLRRDEYSEVLAQYTGLGLNVKGVDAHAEFYSALVGITDPEQKRKAIGKKFIDIFDQESQRIQDVKWLAQGTIYPDVIESVSTNGGPSATIKSHHNVGGLPDYMKLKIVEPLRMLFKDEVRRVGRSMDLSQALLGRHPFPGPGLAIRILGEITAQKVKLLQEVDAIFIHELKSSGQYDKVWQAGAILLPVNSVGVMGDERTYESVVALRAVVSMDGMTADWARLPYDVLAKISNEIINKVVGVNRVVYDISSKPPATIEWE